MKKLIDNSEVSSRSYYYLLDWNDENKKEYILKEFNKASLCDLNIEEYKSLFKHVCMSEFNDWSEWSSKYSELNIDISEHIIENNSDIEYTENEINALKESKLKCLEEIKENIAVPMNRFLSDLIQDKIDALTKYKWNLLKMRKKDIL